MRHTYGSSNNVRDALAPEEKNMTEEASAGERPVHILLSLAAASLAVHIAHGYKVQRFS